MQLFRSEDDVEAWSAATGNAVGAVFPVSQLWELGRRWYDDRLEHQWRRRSLEERQHILDQVGLDGPHWTLDP